jgi:uncharacterized protein YecE (DUF72 family)
MDFGKLASLEGIDFTLPPDHPQTAQVLARNGPSASARVHVGCPVWACREWVGKLYPATAREKDFLGLYTRQFNCIELNTTHYRTPDGPTIARWRSEAAPGFKFCPKLLQEITHQHQLLGQAAHAQAHYFAEQVAGLGDKLGLVFMQLPPYFGPEKARDLLAFLRQWPSQVPLAVEFRHEAWFMARAGRLGLDVVADEMAELGISTVITDVAGRRDVLHQRLTNPVAVLRLVGNSLVASDFQRADDWVRRLKSWLDAGLREAYLFVHEPDNALAPELGDYLIRRLNAECQLDLARPRIQRGNPQTSLF